MSHEQKDPASPLLRDERRLLKQRLATALRREDEAAVARRMAEEFTDFFRSSRPRLVAYLVSAGTPYSDAVDCVDEALARVYQRWPDGGVINPYGYARTIARRLWIERVTAPDAHPTPVAADLTSERVPVIDCDGIDEVLTRHETMWMLSQLPPRQRAVWALTMDGARPAEIAAELGVDVVTVRSNLRHARTRIAGLLRREQSPDPARQGSSPITRPGNEAGR